MASAKDPFFRCVATTLRAALCILSYPSEAVEGDALPEVEVVSGIDQPCSAPPSSPPHVSALRGAPLRLHWTQGDECFIETAHNSARVSFWFAAAHQPTDALTTHLLAEYIAFFCNHGATRSLLPLLRCSPIPREGQGESCQRYDVTFLLLPEHVEAYGVAALVDFVVLFVRNVEADVAGLKVSLNARRRAAAQSFFS